MRQSLLLLVCLLLGSSLASHADTTTFRVSSYVPERFRDLEWRILANAGLSGGSGESGYYVNDMYIPTPTSSGNDGQQFQLNNFHDYRYETARQFLNMTLNTSFSAKRSHSDRDEVRDYPSTDGYGYFRSITTDYSTHNWAASVQGGGSFGHYVAGAWFVGGDGKASYRYYSRPRDEDERSLLLNYFSADSLSRQFSVVDEHTDETSGNYSATGVLNIGYGRIYEGMFAADALHIVNQLRKEKLLDAEPTYDQMMRLTDLIYHERNTHAVDDRIRRIEALTRVLEYLEQEGILTEPGAVATLAVQDVWDYFQHSSRKFGWRLTGGIGGDYVRSHVDRTISGHRYQLYTLESPVTVAYDTLRLDDYDLHSRSLVKAVNRHIYLLTQAAFHRPIDQHWQFDCLAKLQYWIDAQLSRLNEQYHVTTSQSASSVLTKGKVHDWIEWSISPSLHYVFDARTTASIAARLEYSHQELEQDAATYSETYNSFQFALTPSCVYRLSIPTELRASMRVNYRDTDDNMESRQTWSYSLGLSVEHYLY